MAVLQAHSSCRATFQLDDLLLEVELDPEVYAHAQPGLGDLRLTATDA